MSKNIILVGVFTKESTNVSMATSFFKFGYRVIPISYRNIIPKFGNQYFEDLLLSTIKNKSVDLVVFCKCNGVDTNTIRKCTGLTKTWLWNPDLVFADYRSEVLENAKNTTFSSCTAGGVTEEFKNQGVENCYNIFDGTDLSIFHPVEPSDLIACDIAFIGSKTEKREEFRNILISNDISTKFFGPGYTPPVFNEVFAQVCSSAQMMLSVNTQNDIKDCFSNRLLRYMSCGSCVLHYDPTRTLEKYFKDYVDIVYFYDEKDLVKKIKELKESNQIWKIAANARDKVSKYYTWDNTISRILEIAL